MENKLTIKSLQLQNFKAIRDSGEVEFSPLTVFIGDNGSGKSSLVEGLQTYQRIVTEGLHEAMNPWRGFEFILTAALPLNAAEGSETNLRHDEPMTFSVSHLVHGKDRYHKSSVHPHTVSVGSSDDGQHINIVEETWQQGRKKYLRKDDADKTTVLHRKKRGKKLEMPHVLPRSWWPLFPFPEESDSNRVSSHATTYYNISSWQFLMLNPNAMGQPQPQKRTGGAVRLDTDGANIAEYLSDILEKDSAVFDGILESMQFIMPYLGKLRPALTSILGRQMHLEMVEGDFKVLGWLLSTGTLRIMALLALFRHPDPPPLIVVEEIENGLDPRALHLIVEELRNVVESGRSQVIVTTHSPYLLDLLPLSSIVLVERADRQPRFRRPADDQSLQKWTQKFGPGKLYTMGNLSRGNNE